jgi:hypothetical protein
MRSLGGLPASQKRLFLQQTKPWLELAASADRNRRMSWRREDEHHAVLRQVAYCANELHVALYRMQESGIPESYFREAWSTAVGFNGVRDEAFPFPDRLLNTLVHLRTAACLWLPDANPKHRPARHSPSSNVMGLLASEFHSAFGKRPALGDGSPFVKFCREAFPRYRLVAPSLSKMRALLAKVPK